MTPHCVGVVSGGMPDGRKVGQAGEHYVAAEIHRRGGYAVTFAGNMAGIDLLATDDAGERRISIQVKAKRSGTWHADGDRDGIACTEDLNETFYWIFVDIAPNHPRYWITPRWWIRDHIHDRYTSYLRSYEAKHGRRRTSHHHAIAEKDVAQWADRWDLLGIF
jgi:hypothetical protein